MTVNGCRKGKVGERQACHFLTSLGFPAQREARNGKRGANDIRCDRLSHVHIETKYRRGFDLGTKELDDACAQATNDSERWDDNGQWVVRRLPWIVLWKAGRRGWMLTMHDAHNRRITYDTREGIRIKLEELARSQTDNGRASKIQAEEAG